MDAVKTLWERRVDAVRTLCARYYWQICVANPQRADRVSERCTITVDPPFDETEALLRQANMLPEMSNQCIPY